MRIEMRRALAHQVRSPQQAVCAGSDFRRFFGQSLVGIAPIIGARAELITKPAQAESGALRDSHYVPASRHGMTERVDATGGIDGGSVGGGEHDARSTDGRAHRANVD